MLRRRHYSRLQVFNRYLRPPATVRSIATFSVPARRDLRHPFHYEDTPAFEYPYQPTVRLYYMMRADWLRQSAYNSQLSVMTLLIL